MKRTLEQANLAEEQARQIRTAANWDALSPIDPSEIAKRFGFTVLDSEQAFKTDPDLIKQLRTISVKTWSGHAIPDLNVIVVNSNQTSERRAATLMEEVAHLFLKHEPTRLTSDSSVDVGRTLNRDVESDAYWTGAAVLLPSQSLAMAIWHGHKSAAIASKWGVSEELVEFRAKIWNLWKHLDRSSHDQAA